MILRELLKIIHFPRKICLKHIIPILLLGNVNKACHCEEQGDDSNPKRLLCSFSVARNDNLFLNLLIFDKMGINHNKGNEMKVIGRKDRVDFPRLRLYGIDAKIDTGAYTSAIHCHNIKLIDKDGEEKVRFNLLDSSRPSYNNKKFTLQVYGRRKIKNSFGQVEQRYIVKTKILLFGELFDIELSLTDRSKMEYPVLLGRKVLRNRFLVNVAQTNLSYKQKLRRAKG